MPRAPEVKPHIKMAIWGRAAGRCQFRNCGRALDHDLVAGHATQSKGYIAHIVASSPDGARGDPNKPSDQLNAPENLMLLCDDHHKAIDHPSTRDAYPVADLLEMKRQQEDHVRRMLMPRSVATHLLQVSAPIGPNETAVPFEDCMGAAVEMHALADIKPIEVKIRGMCHRETDPGYYETELRRLRDAYDREIRWGFEEGRIRHLSVFGLAPQPLLIELGRLISDISPARVFQRHREPKPSWSWPNDGEDPLRFELRRGEPGPKTVALKLSVTAAIGDDRIQAVLGPDASIWEIRSDRLGANVLRNEADLSGYRDLVGTAFDEIRRQHGSDARLSVFPAAPNACAIEFGRRWQPKAHLPFDIYDEIPGRGFDSAHRIEDVSTPARRMGHT
jgi:hypothetical protein